MSRTYRDQRRYRYQHHHKECTMWVSCGPRRVRPGWCECLEWHEYSMRHYPEPSWWNKGIRRAERAFTRNRMDRARSGSRDWAAVDEKRGDEWYW